MAKDDSSEKDLGHLEEEIESKVDTLFVEMDHEEDADGPTDADPLQGLNEHFLTLEWEIDTATLDKIAQEIGRLQTQFTEGPPATVLDWMSQVTERIRAQGGEVGQESVKALHRLKEGLVQLVVDPPPDSDRVLDPLREEMERLLTAEEEELPTVTLEVTEGEEELLFEEVDRAVEAAIRPVEEVESFEEEAAGVSAAASAGEEPGLEDTSVEEMGSVLEDSQETIIASAEELAWHGTQPDETAEEVILSEPAPSTPTDTDETVLAGTEERPLVGEAMEAGAEDEGMPPEGGARPIVEDTEERALASEAKPAEGEAALEEPAMVEASPEASAEQVVQPEAPPATPEEAAGDELGTIKSSLVDGERRLQNLLERFQATDDPLGFAVLQHELTQKIRAFSEELKETLASLDQQIQALDRLDLAAKPSEPASPADLQGVSQEVLFVSVSNRIFGIPLESIRAVFRVPAQAVRAVLRMTEVDLKGQVVPLVPLWHKLNLGKAIYTFPKEEKRVLLVSSATGDVGLLVDRVLARQSVVLKPVQDDERALFKGMVTIEKGAFVVDMEAL